MSLEVCITNSGLYWLKLIFNLLNIAVDNIKKFWFCVLLVKYKIILILYVNQIFSITMPINVTVMI
jgi:hypothetical protein